VFDRTGGDGGLVSGERGGKGAGEENQMASASGGVRGRQCGRGIGTRRGRGRRDSGGSWATQPVAGAGAVGEAGGGSGWCSVARGGR